MHKPPGHAGCTSSISYPRCLAAWSSRELGFRPCLPDAGCRPDALAPSSVPRMVKKLRLLKGGSVPTFLVLGRCCTTSLPWTLEEGRRGSQAILGYRRLVQQFQCSMAVLELLARATEAWVVAAGNEHLVNRSSRIVDGVSRRCTAGKPVRMDVAGGWRYQFHERLMSRIGILVSLD